MRERQALAAAALIAVAVAHRACALLFRCGCGWWSAVACNVHHTVGPRCPWCTNLWHFVAAVASWIAAAALGARAARRLPHPAAPLAAALLALALAIFVSGAVTVAATGYPHFIWY
jgi:hypothetical protein